MKAMRDNDSFSSIAHRVHDEMPLIKGESYFMIVSPTLYKKAWAEAKSGGKEFKIKNRKLYWLGIKIIKIQIIHCSK